MPAIHQIKLITVAIRINIQSIFIHAEDEQQRRARNNADSSVTAQ